MAFTRPTDQERFQAWENVLNDSVLFTEEEAEDALELAHVLDQGSITRFPSFNY